MQAERDLHTMTVRLSGGFDLACTDRFQDELGRVLDGHTESLLLDLRGLEFIDSTGLRVLVQTDELARSDGVDFTILCRDGHVRDVLRLSGLDGYLPVVDPWGTVPDSDSPVQTAHTQSGFSGAVAFVSRNANTAAVWFFAFLIGFYFGGELGG